MAAEAAVSARATPTSPKCCKKRGLGTLLFDLLKRAETQIYETRFDIALLTQRLLDATVWLQSNPNTKDLSLGYFGASMGMAAVLQAAYTASDWFAGIPNPI